MPLTRRNRDFEPVNMGGLCVHERRTGGVCYCSLLIQRHARNSIDRIFISEATLVSHCSTLSRAIGKGGSYVHGLI